MGYKLLIDNTEFNIDMDLLDEKATDIFMDISGINDRSGRKSEKMKEDAFRIHQQVKDKICIISECRFYDAVRLQGKTMTVGEKEFSCHAFEQLDADMIEGAYLYVISAGDFSLPEAKIIEQLYADLWGNAYTDALRRMMQEQLEHGSLISDGFGPGFYGMETGELVKLGELLDFEGKGISVKNGQVMIPLKTCAGILFKVNDKYRKLDAECVSCMGNQKSCSMCMVSRSK